MLLTKSDGLLEDGEFGHGLEGTIQEVHGLKIYMLFVYSSYNQLSGLTAFYTARIFPVRPP